MNHRIPLVAPLLVALCAAACGATTSGGDASSDAASDTQIGNDVPIGSDAPSGMCGSMTCGANEYCEDRCTCCGIPGGTPSSVQSCRPIPAGCSAGSLCSCTALQGMGVCTPATRTVLIPCA